VVAEVAIWGGDLGNAACERLADLLAALLAGLLTGLLAEVKSRG
jgi:hypothetical protein